MKKQTNNICKMIGKVNADPIYTTNFVYETNAGGAMGAVTVRKSNAVYIVVNGVGVLKTDIAEHPLQAGTVFFTFAGNSFVIENLNELQYIYVTFGGGRADEILSRFGINRVNCVFEGHENLMSLWKSSIEKANENNIDILSESMLLYTISDLSGVDNKNESYLLESILDYVDNNFAETTFSLSECASCLGYNEKYISRVFKSKMNITLSEYVKNLRINNAIFLMDEGITSIKNVALMSGYRDPLYFSSVFKQSMGMTPTEYLKRNKK